MTKKTIYPLTGGYAEVTKTHRVEVRILNDRGGTTDHISIYDVQLCEIMEEVLGVAVECGCDKSADRNEKKIHECVRDAFTAMHYLNEAINEKEAAEMED